MTALGVTALCSAGPVSATPSHSLPPQAAARAEGKVKPQEMLRLRSLLPVPVAEIVAVERALPIQTVAAVTVLPLAADACKPKLGLLLATQPDELVSRNVPTL